MSLSFKNDETPDNFWSPLFLAYRDITSQAPIDKVAYPGVYVTAVCLPNNVYDGHVFEHCLSNLLNAQFRRLIFDIYWDVSNNEFTLCPAQLPQVATNSTAAAQSLSPPTSGIVTPSSSSTASDLARRQDNSTTTSEASSATSSDISATTTSNSAITTSTSQAGSELLQLGPYQCSDDMTLSSLLSILDGYIGDTSGSQSARFGVLQFNLRAAASPNNADGLPDTPASSNMPTGDQLLGSRINDKIGGSLYQPSDLLSERKDLNASWLQVSSESRLPIFGYYDLNHGDDGTLSTPNGWPSEGYLLFNAFKRFLVTYGEIGPEMAGYTFGEDHKWVFYANQTTRLREAAVSAEGVITSGCYYTGSSDEVQRVNNTWAVTSVDDSVPEPRAMIGNMTACGLAPTLNFTVNGTADSSYQTYQNFTEYSIFGWAPGEPRNTTISGQNGKDDQFRCVLLDSSPEYRGHWRVENCQQKFRVACRMGGQPFKWQLSSGQFAFENAKAGCEGISGSEFGMPRTGLENNYLYQHILGDTGTQRRANVRSGVWVNMNDLDSANCWVTTGANGSCTYKNDAQDRHDREVLIPSIAALIVFILTVLTILVKCNLNRRTSRVRRTGPGGWEYEGVPS